MYYHFYKCSVLPHFHKKNELLIGITCGIGCRWPKVGDKQKQDYVMLFNRNDHGSPTFEMEIES